jgi:hypothetical protein
LYYHRPAGHPGFGWHSHEYADQQPELGLSHIFFDLNVFSRNDAALQVVAGNHYIVIVILAKVWRQLVQMSN